MTWLVIALSLALLPHLLRLPVWFALLFSGSVVERVSHFWIKRPPFPRWIRILLTLGSLLGVALTHGRLLGRQAGVTLLCVMLALKLLETYQRRDVYLLITLAYFVVITQFLYNQTIYMVGYMLVTVIFITGTLIVVELQPSRRRLDHIESLGPGLLRHLRNAGWMLAQGVPLMLLLFLLFPRLSSPMWGLPEDAMDAKTGISGEMSPGLISELFIDDSPAFRARFDGPIPPRQLLYWRGPVLWDFDGLTWSRPSMALRSPAEIRIADVNNPLRYTVTMEPSQRNWLFGLDVPVMVPRNGGMQLDHMLYRRRPVIDLTSYEMRSDPGYIMDPELSLMRRRASLALPGGRNPRTHDLAAQWRDELGDNDATLVQRALTMFRQQGFEYSFSPPPLGIDTVDDFLFETRNGYCEYYASAFTVLMRSAGIPARVVTGYQGGYISEQGDYLLVRNSDAHAWSEVWLEGRGWVRVDPTAAVAPDRISLGALAAFPSGRGLLDFSWVWQLRNRLDAIHNFWNDWVVEFNRLRQRSLFKEFGIDDLNPAYATAVLVVFAVLFIGFVTRLLWRAQWLGGLDQTAREYARFCRKLERAGLPRRPSEGPRDFGRRAVLRFTPVRREISAIIDRYVALRYGRGGGDAASLRLLVNRLRVRRAS
jgi:transglutaminase-like putative cysteine protease